jgi:hypothetical protein
MFLSRIKTSLFRQNIISLNGTSKRSIHVEEKIAQLGLSLPPHQATKGAFVSHKT